VLADGVLLPAPCPSKNPCFKPPPHPPNKPAPPPPSPPPPLHSPPAAGANNAINFWLGSLINHAWEWRSPAGADAYAAITGAGLLVGAGVFALPSSILALSGAAPPVCMSFAPQAPKA
jgi:hypothetical protein